MTYIIIFESKSWDLIVFHEICSEATQTFETRKNNSEFINALPSSSSHADGKNKESIDHRGESIMKKSRYSLALHPESW